MRCRASVAAHIFYGDRKKNLMKMCKLQNLIFILQKEATKPIINPVIILDTHYRPGIKKL